MLLQAHRIAYPRTASLVARDLMPEEKDKKLKFSSRARRKFADFIIAPNKTVDRLSREENFLILPAIFAQGIMSQSLGQELGCP
jgi:hypothetical protein